MPAATVIPPEDFNISFQLMAVGGVMARRIADVRAGFTAIAGWATAHTAGTGWPVAGACGTRNTRSPPWS